MNVLTTAECITLDNTLGPDAPIWKDVSGNEYRVASGLCDDCEDAWTPDSEDPAPQAAQGERAAIAGVRGLDALAMMGLVPVKTEEA